MSKFEDLTKEQQEYVLILIAGYHVRNGTKHSDGSWGDIRITHKQFKECLAKVITDFDNV